MTWGHSCTAAVYVLRLGFQLGPTSRWSTRSTSYGRSLPKDTSYLQTCRADDGHDEQRTEINGQLRARTDK